MLDLQYSVKRGDFYIDFDDGWEFSASIQQAWCWPTMREAVRMANIHNGTPVTLRFDINGVVTEYPSKEAPRG